MHLPQEPHRRYGKDIPVNKDVHSDKDSTSSQTCFFAFRYLSSYTRRRHFFCRKRLYTIVSLCLVALVSTFPQIFSTMLEIRHSVLSHRRQTHATRMVIRWFVNFREVFGTVLPSPSKKRIQNETNKCSRQTKQATKQATTYAQTRSDQTKTDIQKQRQQHVSI